MLYLLKKGIVKTITKAPEGNAKMFFDNIFGTLKNPEPETESKIQKKIGSEQ